jgi:hypothetical protein
VGGVGFAVFVVEGDEFGAEAVGDAVEGGFGDAFRGLAADGEGSVCAGGGDLGFGAGAFFAHDGEAPVPRLQGRMVSSFRGCGKEVKWMNRWEKIFLIHL